MICSRNTSAKGPCYDAAMFVVTGPSGRTNALCQRHTEVLLKRWRKLTGFTLEYINTPESAGLLGFSLNTGPSSARNLNDGKE